MLRPPALVLTVVMSPLAGSASPALSQQAHDSETVPVRIAIEAEADTTAARILDQAGALPFRVAVRVVAAGLETGAGLEDTLREVAARRAPIWLALPAPTRLEDVDSWRAALGQVLARHAAALTILEVIIDDQPAPLAGYAVRLAFTEARATTGASIRLAIGGGRVVSEMSRSEIYTGDLTPYVDLLSIPAAEAERAASWLSRVDPTAALVVTLATGPGVAETRRAVMDAILQFAGSKVALVACYGGEALILSLQGADSVAVLLTHDVADLEDAGASLQLSVGGADASRTILHRLLFDNQTFGTFLAYWGDRGAEPLEVSIRLTTEGTPVVHDLTAGAERAVETFSRDASTRTTRLRAPLTGGPMLIDFNRGAVDVFGERSGVTAERGLSVTEIIARHQARQRLQDGLVRNYIARARMAQHFRPTAADPGYDVVSENRYFVAGTEVEWEELSFFVNGSRWGADRPPFPLLQPEKVLTLPLQLRFDEGYRYRLDGNDRVAGYDCYVVRFEPARSDASLYRGTVWIDRKTFARIRVQAVQGGLPAPVVSNEEVQQYAPPVMVDGQPVHLLNGLTARQIMLIAGRNLLVEKSVMFEEVRVNEADFEEERGAARSSDRIMFRETDRGLRYYVKQGGSRVISDRATQRAKAMAMGVTLDPSYAFPLPIFGINYLDFDFGGPDSQLALLFGGVLAAGNIQRAKLGSTPFDASLDFFGIAVPSSDRLYDASGGREGERVLTWPLSTGLNVGWQYTPFQKLTAQYQFRFDGFVRDTTTSDDFTVPSSTVTNGLGASWEYRRGGYSLLWSGARFRRATWRAWGPPSDPDAPLADWAGPRTYGKYSASLSRDFFFNVFHKIHLNAAWFGGSDLDRFSKYQFGLFDDTRIHGVPSSGVRFGDLAMARSSYSLNVFAQYRLDLFLERAWGRDRSIDASWQPITGLGVAVNLRSPKSTILRADFGRSVLPARYQTVGSYNLQILILKPLR
jgi:MucB/RseB N-terminal domain